jgi:hypothetical protein
MIIELSRKFVNWLYLAIFLVDLLLVFVLSLDARNVPPQFSLTLDFLKSKLDLKEETNLATWYSSTLLFVTGLMAFLNLRWHRSASKTKYIDFTGWGLIGALLLILSADETAQIHESLATLIFLSKSGAARNQIHTGAGDWIPFLLPFIIASAVGLLLFIGYAFFSLKKFMMVALIGVFCWIGAIIGEAIEGKFINIVMTRGVVGLLEESLEIIGTTLLFISFSQFYLRKQQMMTAEKDSLASTPAEN